MAHATSKTTKHITLFLSEEEAEYLKDLTQNDLTSVETVLQGKYREAIFTAVADALNPVMPTREWGN